MDPGEPRVDDVANTLNGDGGFGDIGGDDDFALGAGGDGRVLLAGGKRSVERAKVQRLRQAGEPFLRGRNRPANFVGAGHKDQHVAVEVFVQQVVERVAGPIPGRLLGAGRLIANIDRVQAAVRGDSGALEIGGEPVGIEGRRHHH